MVELASRSLTRVTLPGGAPRAFAVVLAGGKIISLSRRAQGSTVTAYEVGQISAYGPRSELPKLTSGSKLERRYVARARTSPAKRSIRSVTSAAVGLRKSKISSLTPSAP